MQIGRYQLVGVKGKKRLFLLDTATGQVWEEDSIPDESWFGSHSYCWKPRMPPLEPVPKHDGLYSINNLYINL